ncbi:hypothetical protein ACIPSE_38290 [Streptomyces sp. NPDC090106]|uniref:hypothetical protein n=1 Tax=Streptomyces sp. NPDC090106 TaxID=3365946 RepID=UPI0037FAC7E7
MHGHGYTQPSKQPPPTAWLVFLRVLFVVLAIFTIGLLSWAMLLRLAVVTRRTLDWILFGASLVTLALALFLVGTEPGDEIHTTGGWTGMALLFGTLVGAIAYYLAADVRHFHQLRYGAVYGGQAHAPAYGYPQPHTPYNATTVPQTPAPMPPQPHTPRADVPPAPHQAPVTPPPPQRPAPARIDQVRAELDELSDYLRRHDGNHEGGR